MQDISIEQYFSRGIEMAKSNYWPSFISIILLMVFCFFAAISIIGILFIPALMAGYYKYLLSVARGEEKGIMESWSFGFKNGMWWKSLLMGIMYGLGILFGFLLFIIPGIFLATVWLLAWFVLVDRDVLPTQALGKSYELVQMLGFWKVFGVYILLTLGIQILSIIPIVNILALFALPFVMMVYVAIYENTFIKPNAVNSLESGIRE